MVFYCKTVTGTGQTGAMTTHKLKYLSLVNFLSRYCPPNIVLSYKTKLFNVIKVCPVFFYLVLCYFVLYCSVRCIPISKSNEPCMPKLLFLF